MYLINYKNKMTLTLKTYAGAFFFLWGVLKFQNISKIHALDNF